MIEEMYRHASAVHTAKVLSRKYLGHGHRDEVEHLIAAVFQEAIEKSHHKQDSGERSAGETE
jgi:hypothetical protein